MRKQVLFGRFLHEFTICKGLSLSPWWNIGYTDKPQVGGLPLVELNHLELQFLLLNDFRLSVPVEELEAYGTMLVEFYAREVMTQQAGGPMADALYMQSPP